MKKAFKKAAAGLALTAALTGAVEWNGYHFFDRADGGNALCAIDRTCRNLTPGEIEQARPIFGDAIDYSRVRVFNRPWFGISTGHSHNAMAPNGNIYLLDHNIREADFSKPRDHLSALDHELTHVWQNAKGVNLPLAATREYLRHSFNYDAAYSYKLDQNTKFASFGLEQQARLVENYVFQRQVYEALLANYKKHPTHAVRDLLTANCSEIKLKESILEQALPLNPGDSCPVLPELKAPLSAVPNVAPAASSIVDLSNLPSGPQ